MKFSRELVEKPWGRSVLPPPFPSSDGKVGEVWFTSAEALPLMVKYLFTSEPLSIQVHLDDVQARARGEVRGKMECWYILDAAPGARLGLGLTHAVTADELRKAALEGSIEQLTDWRPVSAGDFLFVPPGTIHAIGADITLLEFQSSEGLTYRLYDYGRPRELHLDDGISVAKAEPYPDDLVQRVDPAATTTLVKGDHFDIAHVLPEDAPIIFSDRRRWLMPLEGEVRAAGDVATYGECLLAEPGAPVEASGRLLIGVEP